MTLIRPVITEKSMLLAARGVYTFVISPLTNKYSAKVAVEELFGVKVKSVTTSVIKGGTKRTGKLKRTVLERPRKFARLSLVKGQTISLFDLKENK